MSARLRTSALALAALLLFYGLAFGDPARETEDSRPLSGEPGAAGYSALRDWFGGASVRQRALRSDYARLAELTRDHPTGNLLVMTLPGARSLLDRDLVPLHQWVRRGNSLLVLAAICDSPQWARGEAARRFRTDLAMLSGIEARGPSDFRGRFLPVPAVTRWEPVGAHPLLRGVQAVESLSDRVVPPCEAVLPRNRSALPLLRSADGRADGAWLMPRGSGWVLVLGQATPFANRALGRADNARFAGNVLRQFVAPSGLVIFDDGLQGAAEPYDLRSLLADPRVHVSGLALGALWLAWLAGGTRLRMPVPAPRPPGSAAAVAAEGRLLARTVGPSEAAVALLDCFLRRLPEVARAAPETWLAARPGVVSADVERLRALRRRLESGGAVPLDDLHDLLVRLRRVLA